MSAESEHRCAVSDAEIDVARDRSAADSNEPASGQSAWAEELFAIEREIAIVARRIAFQRELAAEFADADVSSTATNKLLASLEEFLAVAEQYQEILRRRLSC